MNVLTTVYEVASAALDPSPVRVNSLTNRQQSALDAGGIAAVAYDIGAEGLNTKDGFAGAISYVAVRIYAPPKSAQIGPALRATLAALAADTRFNLVEVIAPRPDDDTDYYFCEIQVSAFDGLYAQ